MKFFGGRSGLTAFLGLSKQSVFLPLILMLLSSVLVFTASSVYALPSPTVQIIPEAVSPNSSFVLVVDPMVYDTSVRVTWAVPAQHDTDLGLLPREGDTWICYFSNSDNSANCGPTPFSQARESYDLNIKSVDNTGSTGNTSVDVEKPWIAQWEYNYEFNITKTGTFKLAFLLFTQNTQEYNKDIDYKDTAEQKYTDSYRDLHLWVTVNN